MLGADFNIFNDEGFLPVHVSGNKFIVSLFSSIGFDLNKRNQNGESLLEVKTKNFDMKIIQNILSNKCIDIFEPNPKGTYWMQYAVHGEYYKKEMTTLQFKKKVRAILRANISEDDKDLLELLNENVDKNFEIFGCVNGKGESAFWVATYLKNIETAAILRNNSANMNILSKSGETILHFAYKHKMDDIFYFLLGLGASANVKDKENENVLFKAFRSKDDRIVELIQDRFNGDINTQAKDDNTLAHLAILEKDYDRLEYYIKRGINIEIKNNKGYSIFMISIVMFNDLELCQHLIQINSNINTQDFNGNTPLLNILHSKNVKREKFNFLLKYNCDINIQNSVGELPLSVCIIRRFDEEAKILLDKGSVINNKNSQNEPIVNALKIQSQFWF